MIKLVLPTHYYEKIIEKLGGNPAELPDRCECTMVDQIVNLIDNGIEGGGGGGGGFVVWLSETDDGHTTDKTYSQIFDAAKTQPVTLFEHFEEDGWHAYVQYQLVSADSNAVLFAQPYVWYDDGGLIYLKSMLNCVYIMADGSVIKKTIQPTT